MSDLKSKTEDKIDDVAAAAKTTAAKAIDKTKDLSTAQARSFAPRSPLFLEIGARLLLGLITKNMRGDLAEAQKIAESDLTTQKN